MSLILIAPCAYADPGSAGGTISNEDKALFGSRAPTPPREKPAAAPVISVRSHCPITGATGVGRGPTLAAARSAAISACISKGGVPVCCVKHADRI
jgi:hypothetical protein